MTIKDIARESGFSVGTVSRVLNGDSRVSDRARSAVMEVVERYGFVLNTNAQTLKRQDGRTIGVIIKGRLHPLFTEILERIQRLISDTPFTVSPAYIDEDADEIERALQLVREHKPLGIIFLGANRERFARVDQIKVPCVVVTGQVDCTAPNLSSVTVDDRRGGEAAIDYIVRRGHTKIGIIAGNLQASEISQLRFAGCADSFRRHGIEFDPERQLGSSRFSCDGGYKAMSQLIIRAPELTAVFAMSDTMAIGAIRALCDLGYRVPEDVSVMGYDGLEIAAYYNPVLTTIRQDAAQLAEQSVNILLGMINDKLPARHITVPFEIAAGNSVAALARKSEGEAEANE